MAWNPRPHPRQRTSKESPPNSSQNNRETEVKPPAYEELSAPGHTTATIINISAKYKAIISRSILIRSGPPAVYQLKPMKVKFGTLTRMTVGEKNVNKINKTILLVGETGAGKSTLINALVNYISGVKFEDNVCFQIVEEEKKKSQSESQTSDVVIYEIFGFEGENLPYSLTIIDTPGFGDTKGIEHDDVTIRRLLHLFRSEDGVHEVNAVGLVMKASENRLSDRQMYIFDSVMSLFGKNMEKNIVALITHSDGVTPENALIALEDAKIKCAKNEKDQPVHFLFNNHQNKERTEENELGLEYAWKVTERGMTRFTSFLERSKPQNPMTTVGVLNERIRLTACIQNLKERIELAEMKQTEVKQTQEALQTHEQEMNMNEKFTIEVDEVYKDKEPINGGKWGLVFYEGAVCCTVCEENCHYPGCTMSRSPKECEVMRRGSCTVCSSRCPASAHVKEQWTYVTKTRKVQKAVTVAAVKEKYEKHKTDAENKLSLLENLKKEINQLTAEKSQLLDEAYNHVVRLEQIALKADSVSTYDNLDFMIEKMKEKGDMEKVWKLQEMKSRVDQGTIAALRYKFGKIPGAGKLFK